MTSKQVLDKLIETIELYKGMDATAAYVISGIEKTIYDLRAIEQREAFTYPQVVSGEDARRLITALILSPPPPTQALIDLMRSDKSVNKDGE